MRSLTCAVPARRGEVGSRCLSFFYEAYNKPVFSNIASAEQQYMDAVLNLLVRYGIPDPVVGLSQGEFAFDEHQTLYAYLTTLPVSNEMFTDPLQGAMHVGATIEDLDNEKINCWRLLIFPDNAGSIFQTEKYFRPSCSYSRNIKEPPALLSYLAH